MRRRMVGMGRACGLGGSLVDQRYRRERRGLEGPLVRDDGIEDGTFAFDIERARSLGDTTTRFDFVQIVEREQVSRSGFSEGHIES